MSTPPLAVALIPDGTNTGAAERSNWGGPGFPERPTPFLSFVQSYSTLLPGLMGGQLVCGGRRTWELHPSEDLSELHRFCEGIATNPLTLALFCTHVTIYIFLRLR